jgi:hypothetical protein
MLFVFVLAQAIFFKRPPTGRHGGVPFLANRLG